MAKQNYNAWELQQKVNEIDKGLDLIDRVPDELWTESS